MISPEMFAIPTDAELEAFSEQFPKSKGSDSSLILQLLTSRFHTLKLPLPSKTYRKAEMYLNQLALYDLNEDTLRPFGHEGAIDEGLLRANDVLIASSAAGVSKSLSACVGDLSVEDLHNTRVSEALFSMEDFWRRYCLSARISKTIVDRAQPLMESLRQSMINVNIATISMGK